MLAFNFTVRGGGPKLVGNIDQISVTSPNEIPGVALVVLFVGITNWAQPTSVENYELKMRLLSGQVVPTKGTYTKTLVLNKYVYREVDSLAAKTSPAPVATGTTVRGFLIFRIEGAVTRQDIIRPGTIFTLTFRDFRKHEWKTEYTWPVNPVADIGWMPGMLSLEPAPDAVTAPTRDPGQG